jgi:hypothetical protein
MNNIVPTLVQFCVFCLTAYAISTLLHTVKSTFNKSTSKSKESIDDIKNNLDLIINQNFMNSNFDEVNISKERISEQMRAALLNYYGFRENRVNHIVNLFKNLGTPDLIVSSDPIEDDFVLCYNKTSETFSNKSFILSSSCKAVTFWGSEWICESRPALAKDYIFFPSVATDDAREYLSNGIGLVLVRLFAAEFRQKLKEIFSSKSPSNFYDLIWGFDEPKDIEHLQDLFPKYSGHLSLDWKPQKTISNK